MSAIDFPAVPISPTEFFGGYLPRALARAAAPSGAGAVDLLLGVCLLGEGGGEWVFHLCGGRVEVEARARRDAAVTLVQSVADWRGALWEGRGGAIGRHAAGWFRAEGLSVPGAGGGRRAPSPAGLARLGSLGGLVRIVVSGGTGGDWSLGFQLGPGEIEAEPRASIRMAERDAEALASGELSPVEAFLGGRVALAGDLGLLMKLQFAALRG
jgi:hypothetical protein